MTEKWQPIETAPKDGTVVLRPHVNWGAKAVRHRRPEHKGFIPDEYNWLSSDYAQYWPDTAFLPYWMPLPEPPKKEQP